MTDNEIINIGDVCAYSFDNANKSLSVVEIVNILSDEVVVVKFHQVICDDSGNGYFTYLSDTGKTMNVSKKYLTKIDLINRLKSANEKSERIIELDNKLIKTQSAEIDFLRASKNLHEAEFNEAKVELELKKAEIERLKFRKCLYSGLYSEYDIKLIRDCTQGECFHRESEDAVRLEAIKEFAEKVDKILCLQIGPSKRLFWKITEDIKNLEKEMVGDDNA